MDKTIEYYNKKAEEFCNTTKELSFCETQNKFLDYLKPYASILDFGCGAGRDTKYFLGLGYCVTAIDGAKQLCSAASKYTGIAVKNMLFQELQECAAYDGIWACASILHIQKTSLPDLFGKMTRALKENGIIYSSFKYGDFEGNRNGRYFTDFTEDSFHEFMEMIDGLQIEEMWISSDVRQNRSEERWLNIILRKV